MNQEEPKLSEMTKVIKPLNVPKVTLSSVCDLNPGIDESKLSQAIRDD